MLVLQVIKRSVVPGERLVYYYIVVSGCRPNVWSLPNGSKIGCQRFDGPPLNFLCTITQWL